jgi:magnesium transporter
MLEIYYKTTKVKKQVKLKKIRDGAWIDIKKANETDLKKLIDITGLSYLDLQDSLDPHELSRIERIGDNTIIFVRSPKQYHDASDLIHTDLLTIVITSQYFITISASENKIIKNMLKQKIDIATTQRGKLLVYLLLKISHEFTHSIKEVRNNVLSQERNINKIKNSDIINLIHSEEILNQHISALIPMKNVFESISSGKYIHLYSEDESLFEDLIISIRQSTDLCQVNIKSIKTLRDSYQIIFTNKLNKVIQFLAAFTIIMTIPTIVASLYGMNVNLPLSGSPFAFFYVLLISIGISLIFLFIFYKKKWL